VIAVVLLGLGVGAEFDLAAYLVGCYFGVRAFGALHGVVLFSITIGGALAWPPWVWSSKSAGPTAPVLCCLKICLSSPVSAVTFGTYRYPPPKGKQPMKAEKELSLAR